MPSRCYECKFSEWSNLHQTMACNCGNHYFEPCFENNSREFYKKRADFCPLVDVPTPHGRLIDAETKIEAQYYDEEHEEWTMETFTVEEMISIADNEVPTVIEAEGTE